MTMSVSRTTMWLTGAGLVLAGLAIVVNVVVVSLKAHHADRSQRQSGQNNHQYGDGNVVNNGIADGQTFGQLVQEKLRADAERLSRQYAHVDPPSDRPAPYLLAGTPHGVWVRSTPTIDGRHVGAVPDGGTVWADCQLTTDFDPNIADRTGPVWLRIRWPSNRPNDNWGSSQPSDRYRGWMYAGLPIPAGHNGKLPTCA